MTIIDRRHSNKNKSVGNRQKFIERNKNRIRKSIDNLTEGKGITDVLKDRKVTVDTIEEPDFNFDMTTGERDFILPGNKTMQRGDKVRQPPQSDEEGTGGSETGEGMDEFAFTLTKAEFLELYFSDLELPNFIKTSLKSNTKHKWKRSGWSKEGVPARIDLVKTLKQGLARRIATKSQRFLDDIDLRYRHFTKQPFPIKEATMICVDKETEYLSPTGWKRIDEYDRGPVAQYDRKGNVNFVLPKYFIYNPAEKTDFIRIKNGVLNQCVTKEHRIIYKTAAGRLKEISAENLMLKHNSTLNGFRGRIPTSFNISREGMDLPNDDIQFHIAFKADGTYQRNNETNTRAHFCFVKTRKIKRMVEILQRLGWEYKITEFENRTNIYVNTPYRIEKRFGAEWYKASPNQSRLIAEEIKLWDGGERTFTSKHKEDCDYVQYIWSSNGYGTNMYFTSGCWVVSQCRTSDRSMSSKTPRKIKTVEKLGGSYCFNVPTGMWIARRKGKVFITGNCLMDTSGSMGEFEKKLAKKFFLLLYLFLNKCYTEVSVIFISHTTHAQEVTEQEFFYGQESGGTIVSSGLQLVQDIITARISLSSTNVYIAQVSDGDNWSGDDEVSRGLVEQLLDQVQYFAYVQTEEKARLEQKRKYNIDDDLLTMYAEIATRYKNLQARHVTESAEVYPVLRSLFERV